MENYNSSGSELIEEKQDDPSTTAVDESADEMEIPPLEEVSDNENADLKTSIDLSKQPLEDTYQWQESKPEKTYTHPFVGKPGINVDTTNFKPIDYYQLFLTPELLQHIVLETNSYASAFLQSSSSLECHRKQWSPTNAREIKKLLGIIFLMGLIHMPNIGHYWSTDYLFRMEIFRSIMPRGRYILLQKFFHLNNNDKMPDVKGPNRDALYKLRPLIDYLMCRFQQVYTVEQNVAVDESLLLWKGKLHFRQFIPLKRARFGIKMFCLCESKTGYTFRFRVYTGQDDPTTGMDLELPPEVRDAGKAEKVVVYLSLPLLDQGYNIYMDNWYSSVPLYSYLYERRTNACGTVRADRVPASIREKDVAFGKSSTFWLGPLMCVKFNDRSMVYMLSTLDNDGITQVTVSGGQGVRGKVNKGKPTCVVHYNKFMGGVDLRDSVIKNYAATRKTIKWYKKLAIHLLQIALHNAFILYRKDHPQSKMGFMGFTTEVISELLSVDKTTDVSKRLASVCEESQRLTDTHNVGNMEHESKDEITHTLTNLGSQASKMAMKNGQLVDRMNAKSKLPTTCLTEMHFPQKLKSRGHQKDSRLRCSMCYHKGRRRMVTTTCKTCPNRPGLCIDPCFEEYHLQLMNWKR
ncbi:PiggyBac transposable element-derived protein 4 [Trichoplax sp. H2]|nr:PiggyBac transposable element-derived protein 4 [Trichoplax sp. H2]|eukprot:RDD38522.1 PiggyBac transposable element-derived protein 4 [Trichoplax sp. H2]